VRAKEGNVNVNVSVSAEEACDKVDINQLGLKRLKLNQGVRCIKLVKLQIVIQTRTLS